MKSQNNRNQGFSYYFCLMIEGSGSIPLTNGYGSGSRRPKTYGSGTQIMGVIMQVMYCTYLAGARLDETARIQPVRVVANPALRGTAAQHVT